MAAGANFELFATPICRGVARQTRQSRSTTRRIAQLLSGHYPAGEHPYRWDAKESLGRRVPSGVYWLRLTTPYEVESQPLTLLK